MQSTYRTSPHACYSIAWSPFHPHRLAVAGAANFGLVGNGRLLTLSPQGIDQAFSTQDGLYDVAWNELHENQVVGGSGDGSIKLWDLTVPDYPIRNWHEHGREVFSVDWSNLQKDLFCSSSWDGSIKLFTPDRPASLLTIPAAQTCTYAALWSPHQPGVVASCASSGLLTLFDLRVPNLPSSTAPTPGPTAPATPALAVPASPGELLTLDWNKYMPHVIATSGVDKNIRIWDTRMVGQGGSVGGVCTGSLAGHQYAIRKIQWSSHRADVISSAGYDMTCRIWTTQPSSPGSSSQLYVHNAHTEFVVGCAWSFFDEDVLATCSWDQSVHIFRPPFPPPRR
ncbi:WD40 repeat-like protein [Dacryopinax primogenitus]|uniref:Peroxin-7 n=1 Tax=Dacryopinax primogenitus (strain DJM 731) TaxID=1858805 RepID=M5G688_DACPD|nr:WD40 repeat-like protein [Dacryopinax primogenitus]EJU03715.1 WD40 repeat-like protein [Dacryopinax primogenitus]